MRPQASDQGFMADAFAWFFARRVYRRDQHVLCIVEAGAKILKQIGEAGIAVRLYHGDHFACRGTAWLLQYGGDLHRVMAIIVDDDDATGLTRLGKPPFDTGKTRPGPRGLHPR